MQLASEQKEQAKEMRVMKTNNEIVFDMVINKEWEKRRKLKNYIFVLKNTLIQMMKAKNMRRFRDISELSIL